MTIQNFGRVVFCVHIMTVSLGCADPAPSTITVPRDVVSALASGAFVIPQLENAVFSQITPDTPIAFRHEWQSAPSMTLVKPPFTMMSRLNELTGGTGALPPLEGEIVACGSATGVDIRTPIPAAFSYARPIIQAVVEDGDDPDTEPDLIVNFASLRNVSGNLINFRIVPDPLPDPLPAFPGPGQIRFADGTFAATGFTLSIVVSNLHIGFEHANQAFVIDIANITLVCHAVIEPATSGVEDAHRTCGDVNIRCDTTPAAVVSGYSSDLYTSYLLEPMLSIGGSVGMGAVLSDAAQRGLNLHFENFAALGMGFFGSGASTTLGIRGSSSVLADGSSVCSPVASPEPPRPPTRALSRMLPQTGHGQFVGTKGGVMPYILVPEADMTMVSGNTPPNGVEYRLPAWTELSTVGREGIFGVEAPGYMEPYWTGARFYPARFDGKLRMVRHIPRDCFVEPTDSGKMRELIASSELALVQYVDREGREELRHDYAKDAFGYAPQLISVEDADYLKDILPQVEKLGLEPCKEGSCAFSGGWTKAKFIIGREYPFDGPWVGDPRLPFNPSEVIVWLDRDSREIAEVFAPSLKCGYAEPYPGQKISYDQRLADPTVFLNPFMLDQANIPSVAFEEKDQRDTFVRTVAQLPSGPAVAITLNQKCPADDPGRPTVDSCWAESLSKLPAVGYVAIESGFSGTTVPRISLEAAMTGGRIAEPGGRIAAVHGLQDRSGLAVMTSVPRIYRDIGLTTKTFDYRGSRFLDWSHDPSFPGVGAPNHVEAAKLDWLKVPKLFYPDFSSGQVMILGRGAHMASLCALPEQLFATPTKLEFAGGGLAAPRIVSAGAILSSGVQVGGEYRVSPGFSAAGDASRVFFAPPSP